MGTIFTILTVIAAVLLILVVLIQNPKGGGLASNFGSAHQLGGVRKTTDALEKGTWGLAIAIMLLSLATPTNSTSATAAPEDTEADTEIRNKQQTIDLNELPTTGNQE